jgi:hypothetical protein
LPQNPRFSQRQEEVGQACCGTFSGSCFHYPFGCVTKELVHRVAVRLLESGGPVLLVGVQLLSISDFRLQIAQNLKSKICNLILVVIPNLIVDRKPGDFAVFRSAIRESSIDNYRFAIMKSCPAVAIQISAEVVELADTPS